MANTSDYIVFGRPFIGEEEIAEVVDSLRSGWIGAGPKVARFEDAFRAYSGAEHAVALHSCTAALFLAQTALGIGRGDAVITTPLTFVATANSVRHTGAIPLFADVDPATGLLDPSRVEQLLREDCARDAQGRPVHRASRARVKAILPVHLWGQPADVPSFERLCREFGLLLVGDAAHAIEATVGDRKIGTTGDVACFSFYATKNVCTAEGGMVITGNRALADRVRLLAQHGLSHDAWRRYSDEGFRHYTALESGWKSNMTDLQAAMGIHQLARIETMAQERTRQWRAYLSDLQGLRGILLPPGDSPAGRHARHLFTIRVGEGSRLSRDGLLAALHHRGIGAGVHYLSVSEHPAFVGAFHHPVPLAEELGRQTLSLPLGGALREEQRQRVVSALRALLGDPK